MWEQPPPLGSNALSSLRALSLEDPLYPHARLGAIADVTVAAQKKDIDQRFEPRTVLMASAVFSSRNKKCVQVTSDLHATEGAIKGTRAPRPKAVPLLHV